MAESTSFKNNNGEPQEDEKRYFSSKRAHEELRVAVAQILQNEGFGSANEDALRIMFDVTKRYIELLGKRTAEATNNCGRTKASIQDLGVTFSNFQITPSNLELFAYQNSSVPFSLKFTGNTCPPFRVPKYLMKTSSLSNQIPCSGPFPPLPFSMRSLSVEGPNAISSPNSSNKSLPSENPKAVLPFNKDHLPENDSSLLASSSDNTVENGLQDGGHPIQHGGDTNPPEAASIHNGGSAQIPASPQASYGVKVVLPASFLVPCSPDPYEDDEFVLNIPSTPEPDLVQEPQIMEFEDHRVEDDPDKFEVHKTVLSISLPPALEKAPFSVPLAPPALLSSSSSSRPEEAKQRDNPLPNESPAPPKPKPKPKPVSPRPPPSLLPPPTIVLPPFQPSPAPPSVLAGTCNPSVVPTDPAQNLEKFSFVAPETNRAPQVVLFPAPVVAADAPSSQPEVENKPSGLSLKIKLTALSSSDSSEKEKKKPKEGKVKDKPEKHMGEAALDAELGKVKEKKSKEKDGEPKKEKKKERDKEKSTEVEGEKKHKEKKKKVLEGNSDSQGPMSDPALVKAKDDVAPLLLDESANCDVISFLPPMIPSVDDLHPVPLESTPLLQAIPPLISSPQTPPISIPSDSPMIHLTPPQIRAPPVVPSTSSSSTSIPVAPAVPLVKKPKPAAPAKLTPKSATPFTFKVITTAPASKRPLNPTDQPAQSESKKRKTEVAPEEKSMKPSPAPLVTTSSLDSIPPSSLPSQHPATLPPAPPVSTPHISKGPLPLSSPPPERKAAKISTDKIQSLGAPKNAVKKLLPPKQTSDSGEDLFCYCNQPDDGRFMFQCDGGCERWFHPDHFIPSLTEAQFNRKPFQICQECYQEKPYLAIFKAPFSSFSKESRAIIEALKTESSDTYAVFKEPVVRIIPDYLKTIEHPMCFDDVLASIKAGSYSHIADMMGDISLIFKNCEKFNGAENDYTIMGNKLFETVLKKFTNFAKKKSK